MKFSINIILISFLLSLLSGQSFPQTTEYSVIADPDALKEPIYLRCRTPRVTVNPLQENANDMFRPYRKPDLLLIEIFSSESVDTRGWTAIYSGYSELPPIEYAQDRISLLDWNSVKEDDAGLLRVRAYPTIIDVRPHDGENISTLYKYMVAFQINRITLDLTVESGEGEGQRSKCQSLHETTFHELISIRNQSVEEFNARILTERRI